MSLKLTQKNGKSITYNLKIIKVRFLFSVSQLQKQMPRVKCYKGKIPLLRL